MNKNNEKNKGEIIIYQTSKNEVDLKVRLENNTIWLDVYQIAKVFDIDRTGVVRHIQNIYKTGELIKKSTCAKIAQVAKDGKVRNMDVYNLDIIISVGYRVNSKKATNFRIWATSILKDYLVKGYSINKQRLVENQKRFRELQETIGFLERKSKSKILEGQEGEILGILADYSKTLTLLEEYDKSKLKTIKGRDGKFKLDLKKSLNIVEELKKELIKKREAGEIFGNLKDKSFNGVIGNIYQTFGGKDLYSDLNSKAAHLLYLIIKDHPFSDGNKRIASFLFIYFLDKNDYLYRKNGEKKINDNALVAIALLVAESDPKEKEMIVKLIINLIN
ncbi:MAG: virulence protein RhuM/Fic/DOC family protein [Patescibacteria group bacterium]|jgi:death-on-curing family protein|nr:virulence protein RhuM/Fic/DOC family protein [Patescibacteria group bacterium]